MLCDTHTFATFARDRNARRETALSITVLMNGGAEGLPDTPVAGVFGQHPFGMKLEADEETALGS